MSLPNGVTQAQLDNFGQAFSHVRTCRTLCDCGKTYYDWYNTGYDWQPGELDALRDDPDAVGCDHSIDIVEFNGNSYAESCNCWHADAAKIIVWFEQNGQQIADFFKREKARKVAEAKLSPIIE